jgi:hypothetical protein
MSALGPKVAVKNVNLGVDGKVQNRPKAAETGSSLTVNLLTVAVENHYARRCWRASLGAIFRDYGRAR